MTSRRVLSIDVGQKNLGLCCLRVGSDIYGGTDVIEHWSVITIPSTCKGILAVMTSLNNLMEFDTCIIERQPFRNATMIRIQNYLEMYFSMLGKPVVLQHPKNKLEFAMRTPYWPRPLLYGTSTPPVVRTYYMRKKAAVLTATSFLERTLQSKEVMITFQESKKKDDLADSLIQGMAWAHLTHVKEYEKNSPAMERPTDEEGMSSAITG